MPILWAILALVAVFYAKNVLNTRVPARREGAPGQEGFPATPAQPGIPPAPERDEPGAHASVSTEGAVLPPRSGQAIAEGVPPDTPDPWGDVLFGKTDIRFLF